MVCLHEAACEFETLPNPQEERAFRNWLVATALPRCLADASADGSRNSPNGGTRAGTFLGAALLKGAGNRKSNNATTVNAHRAFCFASELRFE